MKKFTETHTVTRDVFVEKCPYCARLIKGTSESQLRFNLDLHIRRKHKETKSK
jgi:hypothetical protein